jgi:hypothetical protein
MYTVKCPRCSNYKTKKEMGFNTRTKKNYVICSKCREESKHKYLCVHNRKKYTCMVCNNIVICKHGKKENVCFECKKEKQVPDVPIIAQILGWHEEPNFESLPIIDPIVEINFNDSKIDSSFLENELNLLRYEIIMEQLTFDFNLDDSYTY